VKELISRFPDREEYIVSTSDFNKVKDRLVRLQGLNRQLARTSPDSPGENKRPTLKRRPDGQDPTTTPPDQTGTEKDKQGSQQDPQKQGEQKEKPTLKRRNP
jgi:hypothetical protein